MITKRSLSCSLSLLDAAIVQQILPTSTQNYWFAHRAAYVAFKTADLLRARDFLPPTRLEK